MSLTVDIDLSQINATLADVAYRAQDLAPVHDDALLAVMADVDQRFVTAPGVGSSGTVWGGETWPALTAAYLKYRSVSRKTGSGVTLAPRLGGKQLRDTGELLQSFQIGATNNSSDQSPTSWAFGSALPKARGLSHKRPMIYYHPQLIEVIVNIYAQYITGEIKL